MTPGTTRAPDRGAGAGALALTLDPVAPADFEAEHRERRPLVVARAQPGRFDGILSLADVEHIVCATGVRAPALRLVRDGGPLPAADYADDVPWRPGAFTGMARPERVAAAFAAGATIVLQGLHLHWVPAARYCRGLEQVLGFPVQANAYHTPAAAQGFGVHHDTHDVFVLQVSGRKRWRIHAPVVELPLPGQRWEPGRDPGPLVHDVRLEAGDTLYLPRGWPHAAATGDGESLHLTIGLHPPTRMAALRAALEACAGDVEFRRAVGPDGAMPGHLLARVAERAEPEDVARRLRRRFVLGRRPVLADQLAQVRGLPGLAATDPVERRDTVIADLTLAETGAVLTFEGRDVRFPASARAAVAAVFAADGPFTAAELPGPLDAAGRLVVVRRLVREGFLRAR